MPVTDEQDRARICGAPATTTRMVSGFGAPGVELDACDICAAAFDAPGDGPKARRLPAKEAPDTKAATDRARARFEARQAKLPPEKRRTWEQACAADHDDLGEALRRGGKRGGP